MKNKVIINGNHATIEVLRKGIAFSILVTTDQLILIRDAGIDFITMFSANNKLAPRGKVVETGKQPMIHKLLGLKPSDVVLVDGTDIDFTGDVEHVPGDAELVADDVVVEKVAEADDATGHEVMGYDQPTEASAEPVRGVTWNKRKERYEAKATYLDPERKFNGVRKFLGYFLPEHVHKANEVVKRWQEEGPDSYRSIMDVYYGLYPERERYRR